MKLSRPSHVTIIKATGAAMNTAPAAVIVWSYDLTSFFFFLITVQQRSGDRFRTPGFSQNIVRAKAIHLLIDFLHSLAKKHNYPSEFVLTLHDKTD